MILTKDDARELSWSCPGKGFDGLTVVEHEETGKRRWVTEHFTVLRDKNGKLWGFSWEADACESCEGSAYWPDEVECVPMKAVEVTVTKYEVD